MRSLVLRVRIYLQRNVKWLFPFVGAVVMGLKPWALGEHYGLPEWLAFASMAASAFVTWVVPNVEGGGVAEYGKAFVVVSLAGIGAAQAALPGGISRADLWTIGTALVASAGTVLFRTTATQAVQSGGPGRLGDSTVPTIPPSTFPTSPPVTTDAHVEGHDAALIDPQVLPIPSDNTEGL